MTQVANTIRELAATADPSPVTEIIVNGEIVNIEDLVEMPRIFIRKLITKKRTIEAYVKYTSYSNEEVNNYMVIVVQLPLCYMSTDLSWCEYKLKHRRVFSYYANSLYDDITPIYDVIANYIIDNNIDIFNDIPLMYKLIDAIVNSNEDEIEALERFKVNSMVKSARS